MHEVKHRHHKLIFLAIIAVIAITILINPGFYLETVATADYSNIFIIILYLPGFFILLSLFETWLPQKFVVKHLGKHSGVKGSVYAFVLGAIAPGPLYLAFPFAATLLKKKVTMFNTTLFICAWSCFKIGEEIFELQFLGFKFFALRILISIPFIILISYMINRLHLKEQSEK